MLKTLQLEQIHIFLKSRHVTMLISSVVVFIEENPSLIIQMKLNLFMIRDKE